MTLQKQIVSYKLYGGLDTKTNDVLIQNPNAARLQDAVFDSAGAIHTRLGYDALSNSIQGGGTLTDVQSITEHNGQLIAITQDTAYTYAEQEQVWVNAGTFLGAEISVTPLPLPVSGKMSASLSQCCILNGVAVIVGFVNGVGMVYSVFDYATKTYYQQNVVLSATGVIYTMYPVASLSAVFIVYESSSAVLSSVKIDTNNPAQAHTGPSVVVSANFAVDFIAGNAVNAHGLTTPTTSAAGVIAYVKSSPSAIVVRLLSPTGALAGSPAPLTISETTTGAWSIVSGNTLYLSWYVSGVGLRLCAVDTSTLAYVFSPVTVDPSTATALRNVVMHVDADTNVLSIYYALYPTATTSFDGQTKKRTYNAITGASLSSSATFLREMYPYSDFFTVASVNKSFCVMYYNGNSLGNVQQSRLFFVDADGNLLFNYNVPAELSLLSPIIAPKKTQYLPSVDDALVYVVAPDSVPSPYALATVRGISLPSVSGDTAQRRSFAKHGNTLYCADGAVKIYDGISARPLGLFLFPEQLQLASLSASGGGLVAGSTYNYVAYYVIQTAQEEVVRSGVSVNAVAVVSSGHNAVDVTVQTYKLAGDANVFIKIYRTAASGTAYNLVATVANDATQPTITYTDKSSDAAIASNELLYTTGGILEASPPPPTTVLLSAKRRLWCVSDVDYDIYYSKEYARGYAAEFNFAQYIPSTAAYGKPLALAALDDKVIVFYQRAIEYTYGDGPSDTGTDGAFAPLTLITNKLGCSNHASILSTDDGVYFQSQNGIFLLDRSLNVTYVGAQVEQYNSQAITHASVVPGTTQLRFLCTSGASEVTLMYDYFTKTWAIFTNHAGPQATLYKNKYTYYNETANRVYTQSLTAYTDPNNALIPLAASTPWITTSGIKGFQRVWRVIVVGKTTGACTLRIRLYYNHNTTEHVTEHTYTATAAQQIRASVRADVQKCEAIRVDIQCTSGAANVTLVSVELEIGVKGGTLSRLPATHGSV